MEESRPQLFLKLSLNYSFSSENEEIEYILLRQHPIISHHKLRFSFLFHINNLFVDLRFEERVFSYSPRIRVIIFPSSPIHLLKDNLLSFLLNFLNNLNFLPFLLLFGKMFLLDLNEYLQSNATFQHSIAKDVLLV